MTGAARRRVLVLDDDPGVLSLLAQRLQDLPVHLVECSELEAAETLLDHLPFGVLIVDLEVSELGGLEGMRLIRHAVSNFSDTKVLVFSGQVTPLAQRLAASLGVSEVLEKPRDLGRLVDLVRDMTTDPFADHGESHHQLTVVEPLDEIIAEKRITSVFQPIFRLGKNGTPTEVFGFEALSRGPDGSPLQSPMVILDYAVRKELAFKVDMLCIESALRSSHGISDDAYLFINSHPRAMSHPDYVSALEDALDSHGVTRRRVVLEVTEQSAIVDTKALAEILQQARSRGLQVALDDYGEGSSNLHLIHDLRPEYLKISGRFCDGIAAATVKQALVRSAVALGQDLGMKTVIERVENNQELDTVRGLGIDYGQGYHLGRPSAAPQLKPPQSRSRPGEGDRTATRRSSRGSAPTGCP